MTPGPAGTPLMLAAVGTLRLETLSSFWIVEPSRYLRLPKGEAPRRPTASLDDALDDAKWQAHRGAFLEADGPGWFLRLVPAWRGPDARGVTTGTIVSSSYPLIDLVELSAPSPDALLLGD